MLWSVCSSVLQFLLSSSQTAGAVGTGARIDAPVLIPVCLSLVIKPHYSSWLTSSTVLNLRDVIDFWKKVLRCSPSRKLCRVHILITSSWHGFLEYYFWKSFCNNIETLSDSITLVVRLHWVIFRFVLQEVLPTVSSIQCYLTNVWIRLKRTGRQQMEISENGKRTPRQRVLEVMAKQESEPDQLDRKLMRYAT